MTATKLNYVYRSGGAAGSELASFYLCDSVAEITDPVNGDIAFNKTEQVFYKYQGDEWLGISEDNDLETRLNRLEFMITVLWNTLF